MDWLLGLAAFIAFLCLWGVAINWHPRSDSSIDFHRRHVQRMKAATKKKKQK